MASVNKPTNIKQRDADINRKLQLYGIYTAFAQGKAPSNKQIDVALNSALESRALARPSSKLSAEGRELVGDVREVIQQAKHLLLSKNEGNLLQDFIWQCQLLDGGNASKPGMPVDKDTAKQHGNEALEGLKTLGTLLISNGQFRKLLDDASVLLRDIAGDGAQKAANKVNPSEEKLNKLDEPAPDNTWHDVPDLSRDNLKAQVNKVQAKNPLSKGDLKQAAQDGQNSADQHPGDATDSSAAGAKNAASNVQDKLSNNMSEEDKQKLEDKKEQAKQKKDELKQRSKDYLDKKMPKERREQTIWRLKKMIVEIQGHPDYQQAIETLLRLAETYAGHTKDVGAQSKGTVKGAHDDDSLHKAEADLKTLLERFANGTSSEDLFESINQIYRDADNDPELKNYFKSLDRYVRKCLQQQGYVLQDESTEEYNALYDKGNYLLRDKYKTHTDRILDEFKYFGEQFDKDPQNQAFSESLQRLFKDLGTDENGQATFKPHLLKDLTNVILPAAFESIHYVPIPRIEYSDPMADAIIENLVIEGDNLAPNIMEFGSDNYWRWGRKQISNKNKNKVMMSVSGIQMDMRDVSYYVKKKQGFPSITDMGVMDLFMGGSGFSFKAALETADPTDQHHFFKVNSVVVDVKHLSIKLKQSKFKLLFAIFKPLLLKVMSPIIQKVLEKVIKEKIQQVDAFLYGVQQEVNRAKADLKRNPDPENAKSMYQQYLTAFQKKMSEGKQKKDEVTADKQVNVAMTQHESLFKNIKLPGGISSKATEYKDLASKGDKWESPVFSLGSAKGSTSIPSAPTITRRSGQKPSAGIGGKTVDTTSSNRGLSSNTTGGYTSSTAGGYSNNTTGAYSTNTTTNTTTSNGVYSNGQVPKFDANGLTLVRDGDAGFTN